MESDQSDAVTHRKGFTKIQRTRYEEEGGKRVRIERQKRMRKFQSGYGDCGLAVPIFTGSEQDTRHVYEVLKEWFDDE